MAWSSTLIADRLIPQVISRHCVCVSGSANRWDASVRLDNAASEAFFSTFEHELLSRHHFATKAQARAVVTAWCHEFYNGQRRHSSAGLLPPIEYEKIAVIQSEAA
jgi:transposase InsO family protein